MRHESDKGAVICRTKTADDCGFGRISKAVRDQMHGNAGSCCGAVCCPLVAVFPQWPRPSRSWGRPLACLALPAGPLLFPWVWWSASHSGQAVGPPGGGISSTGKTRAGLLQMRRRLRVCMRSSERPGSDAPACLCLGKHRICPYKPSLPGVPLPWVTESRRGRLWPSESSIPAMGPRLPHSRSRSMGRPAFPGGRFCSSGPGTGIPIGADRRPIGWRDLQHNGNRELPQGDGSRFSYSFR